jgi:hypothetical protein
MMKDLAKFSYNNYCIHAENKILFKHCLFYVCLPPENEGMFILNYTLIDVNFKSLLVGFKNKQKCYNRPNLG